MEIRIKYKLEPKALIKKIDLLRKKKKQNSPEWLRLNRAYREYEESGELEFSEEDAKKIKINELRKLLTSERLILLEAIKHKRFETITEIARHLKRDIKNIWEDLKIFERTGLVRIEDSEKGKRIIVLVEKISVEI